MLRPVRRCCHVEYLSTERDRLTNCYAYGAQLACKIPKIGDRSCTPILIPPDLLYPMWGVRSAFTENERRKLRRRAQP